MLSINYTFKLYQTLSWIISWSLFLIPSSASERVSEAVIFLTGKTVEIKHCPGESSSDSTYTKSYKKRINYKRLQKISEIGASSTNFLMNLAPFGSLNWRRIPCSGSSERLFLADIFRSRVSVSLRFTSSFFSSASWSFRSSDSFFRRASSSRFLLKYLKELVCGKTNRSASIVRSNSTSCCSRRDRSICRTWASCLAVTSSASANENKSLLQRNPQRYLSRLAASSLQYRCCLTQFSK